MFQLQYLLCKKGKVLALFIKGKINTVLSSRPKTLPWTMHMPKPESLFEWYLAFSKIQVLQSCTQNFKSSKYKSTLVTKIRLTFYCDFQHFEKLCSQNFSGHTSINVFWVPPLHKSSSIFLAYKIFFKNNCKYLQRSCKTNLFFRFNPSSK